MQKFQRVHSEKVESRDVAVGIFVFVAAGTRVLVGGMRVAVGEEVTVGGTGVEVGIHPLNKIVRTTNTRKANFIGFFITTSPIVFYAGLDAQRWRKLSRRFIKRNPILP